jgi:hypothetical protein
MLKLASFVGSVLFLLLVGACTTVPPLVARADYCGFRMHKAELRLPPPERGALLTTSEPDNSMLLMSGGGQHGAFGAGLITRWKEINGGALPRFRTVTGVSTGALLSTDAFINRPEAAQQAYSIDRESQLLRPYARRNGKGGFGIGSYVAILRNNAVADLAPLEAMLRDHLDLPTLRRVVEEADGRRLLVGAVDVDSGDAVVFDMVDMAKKAVASPGVRGEHYRDCYVKAILASSSVPLAAKPVLIDNRLYIDGGARYGVFVDTFGREAGLGDDEPAGEPPHLYILVNGLQRVSAACGKAEAARCGRDGSDPYDNLDGRHRGWSLLGLAQRSSDVLISQIYRFSVADITARYNARYGSVADRIHYMPIDPEPMLAHGNNGRSCGEWHDLDDRELRPLQFHPRYMACLISYGRTYADTIADGLRAGSTRPVMRLEGGAR